MVEKDARSMTCALAVKPQSQAQTDTRTPNHRFLTLMSTDLKYLADKTRARGREAGRSPSTGNVSRLR